MSSPLYLSGAFSAAASSQLQQQNAVLHQQQGQHQLAQQQFQQSTPHQQQQPFVGALDFRMQAQTQYPPAPPHTLPPTPTLSRTTNEEPPEPYAGTHEGRTYRLKVVQEPIRARMCGFGDKDRRPITPPPCILLEVLDAATGSTIETNEIECAYFVVTVDLWSGDGKSEVNLVRHSATSPSISATTASSYPPQPLPLTHFPYGAPMGMNMGMNHSMGGAPPPPYSYGGQGGDGYGHHPQYAYHDPQRGYPNYGPNNPITPTSQYANAGNNGLSPTAPVMITQDPRSAPTGMFTRNLIGSLCVSAFKLADTNNVQGIWFILQDLSVRTEGTFRLKFSFVNVGAGGGPSQLTNTAAPVLATCFSQPFHVFSAKKFPGVIESTPLSKCFATQGIKIPIRKDGNGRPDNDED